MSSLPTTALLTTAPGLDQAQPPLRLPPDQMCSALGGTGRRNHACSATVALVAGGDAWTHRGETSWSAPSATRWTGS